MASNDKTLNVKATGIIGLAVLCSRFLGLIREVLFNAFFGTSAMGVFIIAFRAPNLLRDLFAEGALSISFITIFSKKIEQEGDGAAFALASKMMTLTLVLMSVITIAGIVFAKPMIGVLAPGFTGVDAQNTILLTQIMYPFILMVSLAALVMGMLNAKNVFGVPALASSFFNVGSIVGGMFFAWWLDPSFGTKALIGLAIGTLIGGFLQLASQLPSLWRAGFRFRLDFNWRDAGVRDVLILTVPAIIAASAVQLNVLVNTGFASYVGKEAVAWLNSAFRIMQFPIGIFGVAVATITLPVISRIASTHDDALFGATLARAMRLAAFLTLPSAVGLVFFAYPIIGMIYQHFKFHAYDTLQTAYALQCYAPGLIAYSGIKVLAPGFYAINRKWVPMLVSLVSVAVNVVLNYVFIFKMGLGHRGLAFSTTLSATGNFIALYALMAATHPLQTRQFLSHLLRCGIACVGLAAVSSALVLLLNQWLQGAPFWLYSLALCVAIAISGGVYLLACYGLNVEGTQDFYRIIQRKFSRRVKTSPGP